MVAVRFGCWGLQSEQPRRQWMTNKTEIKDPFKERLNKYRDVIINHIRKVHPKSYIKVMTGKEDALNRRKHFGAHILVDSSYYYITFSRKDEFCEHYFSINTDLLKKLKHCNEDWHLLLINNGKVHTFDAKVIVENAKLFNETTYKVPLSVEISCTDADFRYAYSKESEHIIDFTFLSNVRYSDKFDMHKKPIIICTDYIKWKRREFDSIVKAYAALTGVKVENGKAVGKPVSNAAYKKSYMSFRREVKTGSLTLIAESGETFKAAVLFPVTTPVVTEAIAEVNTSLLVADQSTTNREVFIASDANKNCNNGKDGGQRRLDKELDIIADKLAEKEIVKYTPAEIQRTVISFGSNENMLAAFTLGLTDKGLHKEAAYAAKVFNALNNIDFD